jgi:hypothetical protein
MFGIPFRAIPRKIKKLNIFEPRNWLFQDILNSANGALFFGKTKTISSLFRGIFLRKGILMATVAKNNRTHQQIRQQEAAKRMKCTKLKVFFWKRDVSN